MHDRFKLLLWKVTWEMLPTKVKVAERIGACDLGDDGIKCVLCGECPETLIDLLLLCPYSRAIWSEWIWQINSVAFGTGIVAG